MEAYLQMAMVPLYIKFSRIIYKNSSKMQINGFPLKPCPHCIHRKL